MASTGDLFLTTPGISMWLPADAMHDIREGRLITRIAMLHVPRPYVNMLSGCEIMAIQQTMSR